MVRAYIGLGANLGDPARQLRAALDGIARLPMSRMLRASSLYRSPPMGPADQPPYCNAVCEIETALAPRELLDGLLALERAAGRTRGGDRWGPRTLDLDILHIEQVVLDEPRLHLPHPGLRQRRFVLIPLAALAPDLHIPGMGRVGDLAAQIGDEGIELWPETAG
jgi:2-amino-4-hydroxy-6-hydroxymethyldihydropteridine diphosphokinase